MTLAGYPTSDLPTTQAGLFMLAGLGSMAIAVFNPKFYWQKGWFAGDKPAPLWFGRVLFGVIGILFFCAGAYSLLSR